MKRTRLLELLALTTPVPVWPGLPGWKPTLSPSLSLALFSFSLSVNCYLWVFQIEPKSRLLRFIYHSYISSIMVSLLSSWAGVILLFVLCFIYSRHAPTALLPRWCVLKWFWASTKIDDGEPFNDKLLEQLGWLFCQYVGILKLSASAMPEVCQFQNDCFQIFLSTF